MSDSPNNKYLRKNKWFHGTTLAAWQEICEYGIIADYNKGHELDFGYGFYLSPSKEHAEQFITTMLKYRGNDDFLSELGDIISKDKTKLDKIAVVIEFTFTPSEWAESGYYKYEILNSYDDEFASFVMHNRIMNSDGEAQHSNDFIFGVMSDSNPIIDVARYNNGEIGENELKESFKKSTSKKQLSIDTQSLCDKLYPTRVYLIETGEELDVDDYFNKRRPNITGKRIN